MTRTPHHTHTALEAQRTSTPTLLLLAAILFSRAAYADVTWRGDFSTGNFSQFVNMNCGADEGADSCPGGNQSFTDDRSGKISNFPNPLCADTTNCRLVLLSPSQSPSAITGASSTYKPVGRSMRLRVKPAPLGLSSQNYGDNARLINYPWGRDHRNELSGTNETTSTGTPGWFGQNDDMWHGFSIYIPADNDPNGTFPNPGIGWHTLWQVHSIGACESGGPALALGLRRVDMSNSLEGGPSWQWTLMKRDTYISDHARSNHDLVQTKTPGQDGNYRLWPWNNQANSNPSLFSNLEKGRWHTFIIHVRWSVCDNSAIPCTGNQLPGIVELWVDGVKKYPVASGNGSTADPTYRPTLFRFPAAGTTNVYVSSGTASSCPSGLYCAADPSVCEVSNWSNGGTVPNYVKYGLYRHRDITGVETVYHADLLSGTDYDSVDPLGRPFTLQLQPNSPIETYKNPSSTACSNGTSGTLALPASCSGKVNEGGASLTRTSCTFSESWLTAEQPDVSLDLQVRGVRPTFGSFSGNTLTLTLPITLIGGVNAVKCTEADVTLSLTGTLSCNSARTSCSGTLSLPSFPAVYPTWGGALYGCASRPRNYLSCAMHRLATMSWNVTYTVQ